MEPDGCHDFYFDQMEMLEQLGLTRLPDIATLARNRLYVG